MASRLASGLVLLAVFSAPALAQDLPARAPGLWQSTTSVTQPDGSPLPGATNIVTITCVDPATDEKFLLSDQNQCSSLNVSGSGNTFTVSGSCAQQGSPVTIHETLTYAGDKSVSLAAQIAGASGTMSLTSQLAWQGDCPSGIQPGDEGSMVNGTFSKAGNINDPGNE